MDPSVTLFVSMFTTLLAIINPLEAIPVFLGLMQGKDDAEHRLMARKACLYALLLMFFFLVFGNLLLRLFDVPLSMVRVVGGVILMRIGFELFAPSANNNLIPAGGAADHVWPRSDCHRDRPDLNHQEFRARPDIVFFGIPGHYRHHARYLFVTDLCKEHSEKARPTGS